MVLWKKESASESVYYVDLLPECEQNDFQHEFEKLLRGSGNKNADISTQLRMRGNQQFKAKDWDEAMNLYNKSLRHAPNDSENISLAYANRSVCFFQMKKYEQCLADIELAKKANYPKRLAHKLVEREAACLKLMTDEPTKMVQKVKINIEVSDANTNFSCLVNAINIH